MSALLEELIREQGDGVAVQISRTLRISREEAAKVLPATANVILDRFEPGTCGRGGVDPNPLEVPEDPERSLDGILAGTGRELSERLGADLGIAPAEAALIIPHIVPAILRFLLRRDPYGSMAASVLTTTVATQGQESLDALALRLAKKVVARPGDPVRPAPGVATLLGRWAGKWFPSGGD